MRVWSAIVAAALVVGLGAGCKGEGGSSVAPTGPCDDEKLQSSVEAIASASRAHRSALAIRVFTDTCAVSSGLAKSLRDIENVSPDMRSALVARAVADNAALWMKGCSGGLRVFTELVEMAPDGRNEVLWDRCELERLNFVERGEATDDQGLIISVLASAVLRDSGAPDATKRTLLRALAGL